MGISRRLFLRAGGVAIAGVGSGLVPVPMFLARAAAATASKGKVLVVLFQRGAADGLNILVPHDEAAYYDARPTIAIPRPGGNAGECAIDLDGAFGLHPSLASLERLWADGLFAAVTATGSPDSTRSHFDAQDFMESGTPGVKNTDDGWLNRYLQVHETDERAGFRAVSLTSQLPRVLHGVAPTLAIPDVEKFGLRGGRYSELVQRGLETLYATSGDPLLAPTAQDTFDAIEFLARADPAGYRPADGVEYPRGPLGESMKQIAQLIKAGVGLEIAFAEIGGWDHHVNEGGVSGSLARTLLPFGEALAAFVTDLGQRMDDVVIVTMSEFGRTVRENGNRGTDHGHANSMFVIGGPVRGGRVFGAWPGLGPAQLYEGRDLALTTDFRDVLSRLLTGHLGARDLSEVFPGHENAAEPLDGLLRTEEATGPIRGSRSMRRDLPTSFHRRR